MQTQGPGLLSLQTEEEPAAQGSRLQLHCERCERPAQQPDAAQQWRGKTHSTGPNEMQYSQVQSQ